ncbi:hypothetical protein FB567DRAFT_598280 [Paraphoma chrysanthemicola]|uniref:Uncharacterized protein n=1 Tax=Paraphoma chrysanthemicola TaxID=798071 RepID=A0A8K0QW07_9PLEO|nr:hypothetical protein FB567DRAFT_598280 [Paraphoma chrysanthemicola]
MDVEQILNLFRICFDAAANGFRRPRVRDFHRKPRDGLDIRQVCVTRASRNQNQVPVGTPEYLRQAYMKWNLCDHFCYIVLEAVRRAIQSEKMTSISYLKMAWLIKRLLEHGATAQWIRILPMPNVALEDPTSPPEKVFLTAHSIIKIKLSDDTLLYFDGIMAQYAWNPESWLLAYQEWYESHVDQTTGIVEVDEELKMSRCNNSIRGDPCGYWNTMTGSLWDMFLDLDWSSLAKMSPIQRVKIVRQLAQERVADVASNVYGAF